jgi:hypothetical protein
MQKVTDSIVGLAGIGAISATPLVIQAQQTDYTSIGQVLIQLAIGIVTLLGLLKKKRV